MNILLVSYSDLSFEGGIAIIFQREHFFIPRAKSFNSPQNPKTTCLYSHQKWWKPNI